MKLVIAIVQQSDATDILEALTAEGVMATRITSAGGYLRESNTTLLIGVEEERVAEVIDLVDIHSTARKTFVNPLMPMAPADSGHIVEGGTSSVRVGATVFVVSVSRFVRLSG